jgi:hypothetical protein
VEPGTGWCQSVARFLACYQALTGTSLDDEPYWDLVSLLDVLLDIDPGHPAISTPTTTTV